MRKDIALHDWLITAQGDIDDAFFESVFFTGCGRMGARGYPAFRPRPRPVDTGLFIAGMFDEIKPGITDFVNLPTPIWHELYIDGMTPEIFGGMARSLDLSCGLVSFKYLLACGEKRLSVVEELFFPIKNPALIMQRLTLEPKADMELSVKSGVELICQNQPVPDDQVKDSGVAIKLTTCEGVRFDGPRMTIEGTTKSTGISFVQHLHFRTDDFVLGQGFHAPNLGAGFTFTAKARAGVPLRLQKAAEILTGRDRDPLISPLPDSWSFDAFLASAQADWAIVWGERGIELEGDDNAQTALRYNIFQLICNCSSRDDTVSIGARGLTHTRYKGCYFWDTELFMLPFYLLTEPEAAKNLLGFRVNNLPQAREHAHKMNGAGARIPWMVSYDGSEQCESWDIGCSEVHVTADVAYAAGQYMDITGDREFSSNGGAELLIETARFWVSRYSPAPDGGVNLLWCKGPDEYCGITSNNLFTNRMVQHNLELAAKSARTVEKENGPLYASLGLSAAEVERWSLLKNAIPLPRDPDTGRLRQDDTFHILEPVEPDSLKDGDGASYHKVCYDRLQRYKVIKQADVLLLMTRLPGSFSDKEKLDAWRDFEPLCLHDSTLSFASHALFAFQNGLVSEGKAYFYKALFLDLYDTMGNTGKEGLHLACLGESWQAVVFGIAGLSFSGGRPAVSPKLPDGWASLRFSVSYRGKRYEINVGRDGSSVRETT